MQACLMSHSVSWCRIWILWVVFDRHMGVVTVMENGCKHVRVVLFSTVTCKVGVGCVLLTVRCHLACL